MCWSLKHPVSSSLRLPFTWENHMQKSRIKTFLTVLKRMNQRCQLSNSETITMGTYQLTPISGSPQLQNKPSGLSEIFTRDLYWDLMLGNMPTLSGRKWKRLLPRKGEGWEWLFCLDLHWQMLQSHPTTCRRQSRNLENEELATVEDQVQKYVRKLKVCRTWWEAFAGPERTGRLSD